MISTLLDVFLEASSLTAFSATAYYLLSENPEYFSCSLTSTTTSSLLGSSSPSEGITRDVQDTQMLVESMSLDELYELRDLVTDKENVLKLVKEDF